MTEPTPPRVRRSRLRFVAMVAAGVAAAAASGATGHWLQAPVAGWATAALVYVTWVWLVVGGMDADETKSHATAEDPSRGTTDLLILVANLASLVAVTVVVVDSHQGDGRTQLGGAALVLAGVALSWMLVQTSSPSAMPGITTAGRKWAGSTSTSYPGCHHQPCAGPRPLSQAHSGPIAL